MIKSAKVAKYNLTVNFSGDSTYHSINQSFNINVYQIETHMTVNSKTIIRGSFLYIYLRNSTAQTIAGQNITINFTSTDQQINYPLMKYYYLLKKILNLRFYLYRY